jgi:hypothetical protein
MLNKSPSTLTNWLSGISYPDAPMLLQISEILEVSVDYLLTGKENGLPVQGKPVNVYGGTMTPEVEELARLRTNAALTQRILEVLKEVQDNQD